jgi:hypothetical protein
MVILFFLAAAAAAPPAEAISLARQIAEHGTLASVLPLIQQKETEELVAAHPELSGADKTKLRSTAQTVYQNGRARLMEAEGQAWAAQLSLSELRGVAAFQKSDAGKHYRDAAPAVMMATMKSIGEIDFKGDVLSAYCKETGKLCGK